MNKLKYIFPLIVILAIACEKVIDVDLNEAAPTIVIEGNLSNNMNEVEVKISMTSSYFDTLASEKVSGAVVKVTSDVGDDFVLYEAENGLYKTKKSWFKEGGTYNLSVEANGKNYEASSTLNPPVYIDSVKFYYEDSPFLDQGYYVNVFLDDPANVSNYYRLKYLKNGILQNRIEDLILFDDRYVDGNTIEITMYNQPFELNDTVALQLVSLDKGAYEYLKIFQELVNNNPGSAAPANPNSNISNGALGYFSAWSSSIKSIIIKWE